MSRGFAIGVNVTSAADLTTEKIADEVAAAGLLTAIESQTFLPAAIIAAQAMITAIGTGPFWVWMDGSDNLASAGETTSLVVRVNSLATPSAPSGVVGSTPFPAAPEPTPAAEPVVESQPNGETPLPPAAA